MQDKILFIKDTEVRFQTLLFCQIFLKKPHSHCTFVLHSQILCSAIERIAQEEQLHNKIHLPIEPCKSDSGMHTNSLAIPATNAILIIIFCDSDGVRTSPVWLLF